MPQPVGTWPYMAPEQRAAGMPGADRPAIGPPADVFALALSLGEALAGRRLGRPRGRRPRLSRGRWAPSWARRWRSHRTPARRRPSSPPDSRRSPGRSRGSPPPPERWRRLGLKRRESGTADVPGRNREPTLTDTIQDEQTDIAEAALEHEPSEITYDEQFYPGAPERLRPLVARRRGACCATSRAPRPGSTRARTTASTWSGSSRSRCSGRQAAGDPALRPGQHVAEPVRAPRSARGARARLGLVHRLPAVLHHAPGRVASCPRWPTRPSGRRSGEIGIDARPHRPGQAGRRARRLAPDAVDRRPLRPHQHAGRPGVRHRGAVPHAVRDGGRVRAARSSTTSSRATPARARTSAWPRWATPTTRASTTWSSIAPDDWHLLPDVPRRPRRASTSTPRPRRALERRPATSSARLQRVIFYEPGIKETNWSATRVVKGVDGVDRRWVYLHYFKAGQPSINWLDPSLRRACGWSSATRCTRWPTSARAGCAWTPTASSAPRRAPRRSPRGRRAIRSRRRPTTSSRAWSARWAASASRS